jgi:hypothetical protein
VLSSNGHAQSAGRQGCTCVVAIGIARPHDASTGRAERFWFRFSEKAAHPDFKNFGKASPLLFELGVQVSSDFLSVIVMQQVCRDLIVGWTYSTQNELAFLSSLCAVKRRAGIMSSYASYCQDQGIDCARRAKLARSPEIATYWRSLGFRWLRLAEQAQRTGGALGCASDEVEASSFHFSDLDLERETTHARANADARSL